MTSHEPARAMSAILTLRSVQASDPARASGSGSVK
jgi:hypothetical protein